MVYSIESLRGVSNEIRNFSVLHEQLSSINFNGGFRKKILTKKIKDLVPGEIITYDDPATTTVVEAFMISRVDTTTLANESDAYYVYYLEERTGSEKQYTVGSSGETFYYTGEEDITVEVEDPLQVDKGTSGWSISKYGNAVFSNTYVRGEIEATSGSIFGVLSVGPENYPSIALGTDDFILDDPIQYSGLFINQNNYLLSYKKETIPVSLSRIEIIDTDTISSGSSDMVLSLNNLDSVFTGNGNEAVELYGFKDSLSFLNQSWVVKQATTTSITITTPRFTAGSYGSFAITPQASLLSLNNRLNITSISVTNSADISIKSAIITATGHTYEDGSMVAISGITNASILDMNDRYSVSSVDGNTFKVLHVSGNVGVYTSGLSLALADDVLPFEENSKFRTGSLLNYMSYDSQLDKLIVTGEINADSGNFTGFVTAGTMKIGKDVSSTNDGIYINPTNYWYDDGKFSLGTGTKKIYFDGTDITITSDVVIEGGLTADSITIVGPDSTLLKIDQNVSGENDGLYINAYNYWYTNGKFASGGATSGIVWDGADFTVKGVINATSGNFTNTVNIGGATSGTLQVGSGTNKIKIVGTSSDSTTYINTGSTTATTGNGFYFGADGKVRIASATNSLTFDGTNLTINGGGTFTGSLSIGTGEDIFKADSNGIYLGSATFEYAEFKVTPTGVLTATNATIGGVINATSGSFAGTINASAGIFTGYVEAGQNGSRFGYNVQPGKNGIWINSTNYWYDDGTINSVKGIVGGWSLSATEIFSGTGSSKIGLDSSNGKIYIGAGNWNNPDTNFYADKDGNFSLGNSLFYNAGDPHSFGDLTVVGRIRGAIENTEIVPVDKNTVSVSQVVISGTNTAVVTSSTSHNFAIGDTVIISGLTGNSAVLNGAWQILFKDSTTFTVSISGGVNGTYTGLSGSAKVRELTLGLHGALNGSPAGLGIRLDENNYWFINNRFRVGSSNEFMSWNGSDLTVSGHINATGGSFAGYVEAGSTKFGANVFETNDGLWINDVNYWYDNTSFRTGTYSAFMNWDVDRQTLGVRGTLKTKTGELGGLNYGWLVGAGKIVGGGGPSYMALQSGYYSTSVLSIDNSSGDPSNISGYDYGDAASGIEGVENGWVLARINLSIYLGAIAGDTVTFRNTDAMSSGLENENIPLIVQYINTGNETELPFVELFIPPNITNWHRSLGGLATDILDYNPNTKTALLIIVEQELNFILDSIKVIYFGVDNGNGIYECEAYIDHSDVTGYVPENTDNFSIKLLASKEFYMSGLTGDIAPLNDFNFFSEKNLDEGTDGFSIAFPGDGFLTYNDENGNSTVNVLTTFNLASDKKTVSSVQRTSGGELKVTLNNLTGISINTDLVFSGISWAEPNVSQEAIMLFLNNKRYKVINILSNTVTLETNSGIPSTISVGSYTPSSGNSSKNIYTLPAAIRDHSFWVGSEQPENSEFALDSYGYVTKINVHNRNNSAVLTADGISVGSMSISSTSTVTNLNSERVNNVKIWSQTDTPTGAVAGDIWIVI
jgi:hypothetical protein